MKRIQENILMMDEEGKLFWKSMDAEECIACYHVKAYTDLCKRGVCDEEVAEYFFSRLEDAEAKVRMLMKSNGCAGKRAMIFGKHPDGSLVLFEDLVEVGEACVSIEPIRAMR